MGIIIDRVLSVIASIFGIILFCFIVYISLEVGEEFNKQQQMLEECYDNTQDQDKGW